MYAFARLFLPPNSFPPAGGTGTADRRSSRVPTVAGGCEALPETERVSARIGGSEVCAEGAGEVAAYE